MLQERAARLAGASVPRGGAGAHASAARRLWRGAGLGLLAAPRAPRPGGAGGGGARRGYKVVACGRLCAETRATPASLLTAIDNHPQQGPLYYI